MERFLPHDEGSLHESKLDRAEQGCPGVLAMVRDGREGTLWYYAELAAIFSEKGMKPAAQIARAVAAMQAGARHTAAQPDSCGRP